MSSQQAPTSSDADLANHRDEIKKLMQKPLQAGDIWFEKFLNFNFVVVS